MDPPKQANAAQIALRNLKNAPRARPGVRRPKRPAVEEDPKNIVPQFAPIPDKNAPNTLPQTGLFGGSIQAPSTFGFSAATTIDYAARRQELEGRSTTEHLSDLHGGVDRFAGDDRGGKRQFGGRATESRSNIPTPKTFGSNPNGNAFGSLKTVDFNIPDFKPFGSNLNGNTFGTPKPVEPQNSTPTTFQTFGSNPAGNMFGTPKPAEPQNSIPTPFQNFGSNPNGTAFGTQTPVQSQDPPRPNLFGSSLAPASTSAPPSFTSAPSIFSGLPALGSATPFPFNTTATSQAPQTSKPLGSGLPASTSAPFSFGATPTSQAPQTSPAFGGFPASTSAPFSFGATPTSQAPQTSPAFGGFPASTSAPFSFGATPTSQGPQTSQPFDSGAHTNNMPFGSTPFPSSVPEQINTPAPNNNPFQPQGIFGFPIPAQSQPEQNNTALNPNPQQAQNDASVPKQPAQNATFFPSQPENNASTSNQSQPTVSLPSQNPPQPQSIFKFNSAPQSGQQQASTIPGSSPSIFNLGPTASVNHNQPMKGSQSVNAAQSSDFGDNSKRGENTTHGSTLFGNLSSPTKPFSNPKNIFATSSSLQLHPPSTANNPPSSGMFPPLSQSSLTEKSTTNYAAKKNKMPGQAYDPKALEGCQAQMDAVRNKRDSDYEIPAQYSSNPLEAKKFIACCRMRDLNHAVGELWNSMAWFVDPSDLLESWANQRIEILAAADLYGGLQKRKNREEDIDARPQKRSNTQSIAQTQDLANAPSNIQNGTNTASTSEPNSHVGATSILPQSAGSASLTNGTTQLQAPQTTQPSTGSPSKKALFAPFSTNNHVAGSSSKKASFAPLPSVNQLPEPSRNTQEAIPVLTSSFSKGKRKAEDELTQDTEQVNPLRAAKAQKLNNSISPVTQGSNTSALFSSILDSPEKSKKSPAKIDGAEKSRSNPFANIPIPQPVPRNGTEKTSTADKPFSNPFGNLPIPPSHTNTAGPTSPTRSRAFDPAATTSPTPNMFSIKGVASTSTPNMFNSKDASNANKSNSPPKSELVAPQSSAPVSNPFQVKPASANGPPKFGSVSGPSAMEQFRQKAKEDEEAKERKKMEEDKDNEWDSENEQTESDFEREWYAKRAKQKKQLQKETEALQASGPKFTFKPSQENSKKNGSDAVTNTASSSLFALPAASQISGNSTNNSNNGSRTSTPGPFGSAAGSVIGGSGPSQPTQNIFGHLSGTDSGRGEEEDSDDADDEDDSENNNPKYFSGLEAGKVSATPAEETGASIAATTNSGLFNFSNSQSLGAASSSGTSTPGRSLFDRIGPKPVVAVAQEEEEKPVAASMTGGLFDRITKDSNGDPVRIISPEKVEEKPKASLFPLGNSNFAPKPNQTWNQNSPIKFGSGAAPALGTPKFNFAPATPTKPTTNLFGSSTGTPLGGLFNTPGVKPATSSLFPSLSGTSSKPASSNVGFAFGGTSSGPSSLFPSVAASAATSRGTSPGATTDGTSDADAADPDEDRLPQVDLTSGGQGEEDEEVMYEVRAKALSYDTEGKVWNTLGVGPLRILKHKESGVARVLLRADPSGKIVLNNGILNLPYNVEGKTVKFVAANGGDLETYLLQVKTPESAQKLADVLTENKAN